MPKPLIILEQHFGADAREFLSTNAQSLKDIGYKKFLLEMNQEISVSQFKSQCIQIENAAHVPKVIKQPTKALYKLLIEFEKHGIDYEFIDPETQQEAARQNEILSQASQTSTSAYQKMEQRRNKQVARRDIIMTKKIIHEAKENQGGVIFLGGFMHQTLVHVLSKSNIDSKFLMLANSDNEKEINAAGFSSPHDISWANFYNLQNRQDYYQVHINHFNLTAEPNLSFELIESCCELTSQTELALNDNAPAVCDYFNEILPSWQHTKDEKHIVKASKVSNDVLTDVYNVGRSFPGIKLFVSKEDNQRYKLSIPGLNLSDNRDTLKSTFVEKGIMQASTIKR